MQTAALDTAPEAPDPAPVGRLNYQQGASSAGPGPAPQHWANGPLPAGPVGLVPTATTPQAPTQKGDTSNVHRTVTLELMYEKLMCIEALANQVRICESQLSGQIRELKDLLSESGGGRPIDTSTAGSQ
jgi:hypothetical protein